MCKVLAQFEPDSHWETYFAQALSLHQDREFQFAVSKYSEAISIIERDPNTEGSRKWASTKEELTRLVNLAGNNEELPRVSP